MSGKVIHLTATIRIPAELAAKLDALAEQLSTPTARASRSSVAKVMIEAGMRELERERQERER
jgi:predicted DNA-binding protein